MDVINTQEAYAFTAHDCVLHADLARLRRIWDYARVPSDIMRHAGDKPRMFEFLLDQGFQPTMHTMATAILHDVKAIYAREDLFVLDLGVFDLQRHAKRVLDATDAARRAARAHDTAALERCLEFGAAVPPLEEGLADEATFRVLVAWDAPAGEHTALALVRAAFATGMRGRAFMFEHLYASGIRSERPTVRAELERVCRLAPGEVRAHAALFLQAAAS